MRSIEKINNDYEENYITAHDGSINAKINDIVKTVFKAKNDSSPGTLSLNIGFGLNEKI